ncbi:MAG TPA: AraC family transcriptional regulator [Gammaproteobacteria bacterium]|jgi:AraC-like DNA-binding protein|nr:AraC family transcriptional regulator [Gammaproteobacteria bacterium]
MDVLSDVLRAVRLTGALYFDVSAAHPWIAMTPSMKEIGAAMMPGAGHVIPFHIMVSARGWARPEDASVPAASFEPGDIVMFPDGEGHLLTSDAARWDCPPADPNFYAAAAESGEPFTVISIGGGGEPAGFVCGYLGCDASPFNPLLGALPRMLIVKGQGSDALMRELLRAALEQKASGKAGAATVVVRAGELMFLQAVRQHMHSMPESASSWLAGLRDEQVSRALQLIHARPAADWSLASLAKQSGVSRSVLAERFARFTGEPPMRYVGRWRMQLASTLLTNGSSIGRVADDVGYRSEAAFQRAFKKYVGVTCGEWRKRAQHARGAVV